MTGQRPPLDPDPLHVEAEDLWDPEVGARVQRPSSLTALLAGVAYGLVLGLLAGILIANHVLAASPAAVEPVPAARPQPEAPRDAGPGTPGPEPATLSDPAHQAAGASPGAAPIGDAASAAPQLETAASLSGTASWYAARGLIAAAGPGLRVGDWRGSRVTVSSGGRSVVVTLSDFCQCYRGEPRERLIDLSDDAFARLAPLSRGLLRVTVSSAARATLPPTEELP